MPKITDAFVKSAKPIDGKLTEYADIGEKGLSLRVTPAGVKSWTYRYRNLAGKQKRISLGKYHDVSLAEARERVVKHRATVADGGDPSLDAMKIRESAKQEAEKGTIQQIGNWYFDQCEKGRHRPNVKNPKRQSTIDLERYYFDKHIVPKFGNRLPDDISRAAIQSYVDELEDQYSPSTARQARIILHAIFAFAQRQEIANANPVQFVTVAAQKARERVLNNTELRTVWKALMPPVAIEGAAISACVAYSVLLAMVTLQRRGEVTGMRLSEIDREKKLWTLPGTRTKNHRVHVVPLSELALELIDAALSIRTDKNDFVFSSPRLPGKPVEPKAMTRAFGRMRHALGLIDIRPHDLRRTGTTNLTGENLGFPRFIISKVLNQTDSGGAAAVTAIYDRNDYLPEKRRALDAWAMRLLEIVNDEKREDNVVTLGA